jgi:hypothetical protein
MMLDKIWLTTALFSLVGFATMKAWGDFDKHPLRISLMTIGLAMSAGMFVICTLIKIWAGE